MRRRWGPLFVLVATMTALTSAPAGAHVRRENDAADKAGRFDIKQVAIEHGRSRSCAQRCVEIGIQTYENWSPKLLGPDYPRQNFYVLFGSQKGVYDRYLWIWWVNDHLIASMKDYNGKGRFTTHRGRFLGAAAVAKEGNNLAVRFPMRLLRNTRGNHYNHTKKVWWWVVSEFKGKGCRHVCMDWGPRFGVLHRF